MLSRVLQSLTIAKKVYKVMRAIMKRKLAFLFSTEANNDLGYMN